MTPARPLSQSAPRLVVRGPESLPSIVPHLVGFHPCRSIVAVGLGPDGRTVRVTLRVDLPDPSDRTPELLQDLWGPCLGALLSVDAHEVIVLVYPDRADDPWRDDDLARDLPDRDLLADVAGLLEDAGVHALDALCVVGDRWRSYWCEDLSCCPVTGRAVDPGEALRARAMFVEQGSAPLASREELVASLELRPDRDPLRLLVAAHLRTAAPLVDLVAEVDDLVSSIARWGDDPRDTEELARLAAATITWCAAVRPRDLLLRALTAEVDRGLLVPARAVLSEAVRCVPAARVAPVATVLAICAWVSGGGATARVALDRAFEGDPAYSLAGLVSAALDAGTPPWTWSALMSDLAVEEILGVDTTVDRDDDLEHLAEGHESDAAS